MTRKIIALTLCVAFVCAVALTGCGSNEVVVDTPAGGAPRIEMPTPPAMPMPTPAAAPGADDGHGEEAPAEGSG